MRRASAAQAGPPTHPSGHDVAEPQAIDAILAAHELLATRADAVLATGTIAPDLAIELRGLHARQRALIEDHLAARVRAHARVRDALGRLANLGAVSQIIARCATEAAAAADLDGVLLSRIEDGALVPETLHLGAGDDDEMALLAKLSRLPVALQYPLLEYEIVRRRRTQLIASIDRDRGRRHAFVEPLGWNQYIAAPLVIQGRVTGFLHGDRAASRGRLGHADAEAVEQFADGFAQVLERAVLRRRLREQRREIARIASWAESRAGELSDGAVDLCVDSSSPDDREPSRPRAGSALAALTPRELDVLTLMADGKSNADIARTLIVSNGTVKFHVKNILRKLQAANRGDAISRYLRATLRQRSGQSPTVS
jgi:DNA-binding CsgD family transcriptional regulator